MSLEERIRELCLGLEYQRPINTRPVPSGQNKHEEAESGEGVGQSKVSNLGSNRSIKGPGTHGSLGPQPPGLGGTRGLETGHIQERQLKVSKEAALCKVCIPRIGGEAVQGAAQQTGA